MKKVAKIFGYVVLAVVVLLFLLLIWTKDKIDRGELVKVGDEWITHEEFHKLVDGNEQMKNTPQEVYTVFRRALLDNDLEKALSFIDPYKKDEYRKAFEDKAKLKVWAKKLPKTIRLQVSYENSDLYDVDMDGNINTAIFRRSEGGYWLIEKI